jgi:hypothetical protein
LSRGMNSVKILLGIFGSWWNLVVESSVTAAGLLIAEVEFATEEEDSDAVMGGIPEASRSGL